MTEAMLKLSGLRPTGFTGEGVSLEVRAGEIMALLGPSGAGKTRLLRAISGLDRDAAGQVYIGGVDQSELAPQQRRVSMVFDTPALFGHLNVEQNVALAVDPGRGDGTPSDEVDAALTALNLGAVASARPQELSAGERQRVSLARALVARPQVMLFDEPLSHVDSWSRSDLRREIQRTHRRTGGAALYVTHEPADALAVADRIAVMQQGRLVQLGTPREVFTRPASVAVAALLGVPNFLTTTVLGSAEGVIRVQLLGQDLLLPAGDGLTVGQRCVVLGPASAVHLSRGPQAAQPGLADTTSASEGPTLGSLSIRSTHSEGAVAAEQGRILNVSYAGEHLDVAVETGDGTVLARTQPPPLGEDWKPGDGALVDLVAPLLWALPH